MALRIPGAASRLLNHQILAGLQLESVRYTSGGPFGVGKDKQEPAASPWIKVLQRPGDDPANRSEDPPAVPRPDSMKGADSTDASYDVPEKNPDTRPQAPMDPELVAASEANPSVDSVRHMAGKLNEAVGGSYDFPKTGGASVREMASEIKDNIKEKISGDQDGGKV